MATAPAGASLAEVNDEKMNSYKNKKKYFIFISIALIIVSIYFLLATLNSAVNEKYGVFNPIESFYYSTLNTEAEKTSYIKEIKYNNMILKAKPMIYLTISIISFISAVLIILYRDKLLRFFYKI